jgi:hypothetical protein
MDIKGVYRFSSLMKQKIKGKNCFVIARFFFKFFFCYEVFAKQKKAKHFRLYYSNVTITYA